MASLTETAYVARRGIQYGAIGSVVVLVLWFVGTGLLNYWLATHPPDLPPPTQDFGKLSAIIFPESPVSGEVKYDLQTPTGKLGQFPDRMTIFDAPSKRSGFLDPDRATDLATRLGFLFTPTQPSETLYRWTQADPIPATLEVDIVSERFQLKRQWQADPSLVINKKFISEQQAIVDAQNYLRGARLLPTDIGGNEKVTFWRAQGSSLVQAVSLSEADFVRVDFFRKPYQVIDANKQVAAEYNFYTPDPTEGIISVLLSGSGDRTKQVIEISYDYITVNYDLNGTYPIKTIEEAWEELKNGEGFIASLEGENAIVRRVGLGYYDTLGEQKYTMPIYVFSGDNDFVGYVSAVSKPSIEE